MGHRCWAWLTVGTDYCEQLAVVVPLCFVPVRYVALLRGSRCHHRHLCRHPCCGRQWQWGPTKWTGHWGHTVVHCHRSWTGSGKLRWPRLRWHQQVIWSSHNDSYRGQWMSSTVFSATCTVWVWLWWSRLRYHNCSTPKKSSVTRYPVLDPVQRECCISDTGTCCWKLTKTLSLQQCVTTTCANVLTSHYLDHPDI